MNNKLFARIMTAVICICMMSTVVFAAETGATPTLTDVDADTKALGFVVDGTNIIAPEEAADMVTMMAYLVDAETAYADAAYVDEDTTPMIAIDQYDGNDIAETVNVLASKIVEGMKVVVQTGDSNEGGDKWIIAQEVVEDEVVVTFMNGATATPVVAADGTVTLPAAPTLTAETGYAVKTFTFYGWVDENDTVLYTENLTGVTENMTLYAKYVTNVVYGDVTGDGIIKPADRLAINAFLKDGTLRNFTNKKVYPGIDVTAGDVTGDNVIKPADRLGINAFLKDGTIRNKTNTSIYYVNKIVEE